MYRGSWSRCLGTATRIGNRRLSSAANATGSLSTWPTTLPHVGASVALLLSSRVLLH